MIPVSSFQPWLGVSILMRFGLTLLLYIGSVIPVPGRIFYECSFYVLNKPNKKKDTTMIELYNHTMTNEGNCKLSGSTQGRMNPGALDTSFQTRKCYWKRRILDDRPYSF